MSKLKYWNGSQWVQVAPSLNEFGNLSNNFNTHLADYTLQIPYGGTSTNSGNNYSISSPVIDALVTGWGISFRCNADSTGATTLNWDGKGAKPIKKANGTDVTNLKNGGIYTLRYDGTNFILQGEGASGNALASDLLSGKTATVDAGEILGTLELTGNALVGDVLSGKTFYNTDAKTIRTGTGSNAKRYATGTATVNANPFNVSGLAFRPLHVIFFATSLSNTNHEICAGFLRDIQDIYYRNNSNLWGVVAQRFVNTGISMSPITANAITSDGFSYSIPSNMWGNYTWIAYGA